MIIKPAIKPRAGKAIAAEPHDPELLRLHHLAELGRLSASLLHEISNPLTSALLYLEQLNDKSTPAVLQARQSIQTLKRYVEAAQQQVRLESQIQSFSVGTQMNQVKRVVRPLAKKSCIDLSIEPVTNCRIYGDPVKFQQILANLIINAIEAYDHDMASELKRSVRVILYRDSNWLIISVRDWGQGICNHQLPRIFEPFYTTKNKTNHGLGIGLAIVKQYVITDFQGSIHVRSTRRRGTEFTIRLPLTSDQHEHS